MLQSHLNAFNVIHPKKLRNDLVASLTKFQRSVFNKLEQLYSGVKAECLMLD